MGVVETQGLGKRYAGGSVVALEDLTLDLGGGVTGLVGANGAGKSTLIKLLLGLLSPTSGSARVLGHDVTTGGAQIRQLVGYLPEHDCLPPDMRAIDFVVHMGRMSGLPAAAARERAADVLRHVGLAEERYRLMGTYSTGMKQRAKLAQALVHDPQLVLLDEPTNGLDPAARDDMLGLIRRIGHDFGIPVLVTSHLLGELERVSDHVVVLDAGHLLRSEPTQSFLGDTGVLVVEVLEPPGAGDGGADTGWDEALGPDTAPGGAAQSRMGEALTARGLVCRPHGSLIEIDPTTTAPDDLRDLVRDAAADLGLGLVRLQAQTGQLEDVFRDEAAR